VATFLTYLLGLLVVGGGLFLLASFAFGRGEELAPMPPDGTPVELPDGRFGSEAIRALRISVVLRGYRMDEVDWILDMLAKQLDERDAEITRLRAGAPADELPLLSGFTADELPLLSGRAAPEPADSAEPADRVESSRRAEPAGLAEPVGLAGSSGPAEPVESADAIVAAAPAAAAEPPVRPAEPPVEPGSSGPVEAGSSAPVGEETSGPAANGERPAGSATAGIAGARVVPPAGPDGRDG